MMRSPERCCTQPTAAPTPLTFITLSGFRGCGGLDLDGGYYFAGMAAGFPR
jgi:hypothetical protein